MIPDLARRLTGSFVTRLVLAMVAVPVVVALVMALVLSRAARQELDDLLTADAAEAPWFTAGTPADCAAAPAGASFTPTIVTAVDAGAGECLGAFISAPTAAIAAADDIRGGTIVRGEDGRDYAIVGAVPFAAVYAQDRASFLDSVNRVIFVTAGGSALLAGACAFLLARRIGSPLRRLQSAAKEVGAGNLTYRVDPAGASETRDLAEAFNQMAADLTRAEELRRGMTANVAHELRTPLANVSGYLDAIDEDVLAPNAATFSILREETASLVRLVDDLEQLALGDAGALTLHRAPVALDALVEQVVASFAVSAGLHEVRLTAQVPPTLPDLNADPHRLAQVLRNLMSNAIRHTPKGGVVTVRGARVIGGATIEVRDTGEGIPPDHLDRIFEPFYRVDPSRVRATGGSGLGLAVVRRLVEAHGGTVSAASSLGHGSSFLVHIPAASTSCPATPTQAAQPRAYGARSL